MTIPLPLPLEDIEKRINLLRHVDISTLDLEDRVEYHQAMIKALTSRLKHLLFYFNYKTALVVEAEIHDEQKRLLLCMELLTPAQTKRISEQLVNRFTIMAEQGRITPIMSLGDIERNIRTILFGVPYELQFEGTGYLITKTFPGLNIEVELEKLETFCKDNSFRLVTNEKRTKRKEGESEDALFLEIISK